MYTPEAHQIRREFHHHLAHLVLGLLFRSAIFYLARKVHRVHKECGVRVLSIETRTPGRYDGGWSCGIHNVRSLNPIKHELLFSFHCQVEQFWKGVEVHREEEDGKFELPSSGDKAHELLFDVEEEASEVVFIGQTHFLSGILNFQRVPCLDWIGTVRQEPFPILRVEKPMRAANAVVSRRFQYDVSKQSERTCLAYQKSLLADRAVEGLLCPRNESTQRGVVVEGRCSSAPDSRSSEEQPYSCADPPPLRLW